VIQFTNTLTGRKQEFRPLREGQVTMYVCGVTVYDDCHIGHARGAVVFDVLRRFLESPRCGYRVRYVRNITDVDDKIIDRARAETTPGDLAGRVKEAARRYTERFQQDFRTLGLLPPEEEPRATEFIPQMVRFIGKLLQAGAAYEGSDGVYFAVRELARQRGRYGDLSHQRMDQMLEGVRGEPGEGKRDPLDFALWKKAKPEEPAWESPWGPGRPGWHIECSTMATELLGEEFDIHGGGQDLIFPHHENELAQALGAGKPFARYWLHNGLLTVGGQKMSKSLGNFVTIEEALKRHPADVLRLFFLSAHYRSPLDFTWERLRDAGRGYERLITFVKHVDALGDGPVESHPEINNIEQKFYEFMEDDLQTSEALAALFTLIRASTSGLLNTNEKREARNKMLELGRILGFFQEGNVPVDSQARKLVEERDAARAKGDFSTSDRIRKQLHALGYVIEDTTAGTVVRKRA